MTITDELFITLSVTFPSFLDPSHRLPSLWTLVRPQRKEDGYRDSNYFQEHIRYGRAHYVNTPPATISFSLELIKAVNSLPFQSRVIT